mgnify:CR=1 FL=1|jgi:hypothetical protein
MNQTLGEIASNAIYRTCFKYIIKNPDATDSDRQAAANCFERLSQAYKIVAPVVFQSFEGETAGGEEGAENEGGDDE